jgi:hypothetical protein
MTGDQKLGIGIAALAAWLLYYLNSKGLLHESVSSIITPQGTIIADPITGAPQYDASNTATIPPGVGLGVAPLDAMGHPTPNPADPTRCSCPSGFTLWHNISPDSYWCIPDAPATSTGSASPVSGAIVRGPFVSV